MLTGKQALARIDKAISDAQDEARKAALRLEETTRRELVLREEERVCFSDLARFRVTASVRDDVTGALEDAGRQVSALLDLREAAREALETEITASEKDLEDLQQARKIAAKKLETASRALDEAEAAVQDRLAADKTYSAQLKTAEASQKVAEEAEAKRTLTQDDRKTKGAPYEADPLFSYLWKRKFGTSDYQARGLIRAADSWVARMISFESARQNYFMLLEIPKRLKSHVEAMSNLAEADLEALVALEEAARSGSEVPALEARHKSAREDLDAVDADIARSEAEARTLDVRRAAFLNGEDEHFTRAMSAVSSELKDDSLADLKRAAFRTPEPEDELIVARLQRIDDELDDIEEVKSQLSGIQAAADNRVRDIQDLRAEFRRKRYDDYTSEFSDGDLFASMLLAFIGGALSSGGLWGQLDRNHRRRPRKSRPDFGSGRFRFPGPTSFPGSRSGSRRGRSSGGFSTGGGFGGGSSGGGFRTGGGF